MGIQENFDEKTKMVTGPNFSFFPTRHQLKIQSGSNWRRSEMISIKDEWQLSVNCAILPLHTIRILDQNWYTECHIELKPVSISSLSLMLTLLFVIELNHFKTSSPIN